MTAKRAQSRRAGKEPGAVAATEARWPADAVERRPVSALLPYIRNARTHSDEQVAQFESQQLLVPARIQRQLVVGDDVRPPLRLGPAGRDHDRHLDQPQPLGRKHAPVARNNSPGLID